MNFAILLASSPIVQIMAVRLLCIKKDKMTIFKLGHIAAILIKWAPDERTEFHTHGESVGALRVMSGRIKEEIVLKGTVRRREIPADSCSTFERGDIHRLTCVSQRPTVTLHLYSNDEGGLKAITEYETDFSGELLFSNAAPIEALTRAI